MLDRGRRQFVVIIKALVTLKALGLRLQETETYGVGTHGTSAGTDYFASKELDVPSARLQV